MENAKQAVVTAIVIAGLLGLLVGVMGITLANTAYKYKKQSEQLNQCLCLDTIHRNGAVFEVKVINPSK